MDIYRIANFIMQAAYLPMHLFFVVLLLKQRQPSPVWRGFIVVVSGLWIMVSGRFFETLSYLFLPDNRLYTFAVIWQLVGTTCATAAYLKWNLRLAGHDKFAENRLFSVLLILTALFVCVVICTNSLHHLFYSKLVMGEPVGHGPLFLPCLLIVYGMLFAGYIISLIHIIRKEQDKLRRIIVFSLYPILPAAAALIRSITKVDRLDYTPIIMTVSILCLYLIVFRLRYVNLVPQSVESALRETKSAIFTFDPKTGEIRYRNEAVSSIAALLPAIKERLSENPQPFEGLYDGRYLKTAVSEVPESAELLVTVSDYTDLYEKQETLEKEIAENNRVLAELEEKKRDLDAYLEALLNIPNLREKQEILNAMQESLPGVFASISDNLTQALEDPEGAESSLKDNLVITEKAIGEIRAAVTGLREGL